MLWQHASWAVVLSTALAILSLHGCSSEETTFFAGTSEEIDDSDIDPNPATVGNNQTGEGEGEGEFDPIDPADLPADVWIPKTGDFVFRDEQTGSLWNVRGQAYHGPLEGRQLRQLPAFTAMWFAWSSFRHGGSVWNRDELNTPGEIAADDACDVPCNEIRGGGPGKDGIPALDHDGRDGRPVARMVAAADPEAAYLVDGDKVLGVMVGGEARAYSHNLLFWHEIYNDSFDGTDLTVSFCPLTGTGLVFDGEGIDFGVSGKLFNTNLVLFDRQSDTYWSQIMMAGITGPRRGDRLELLPVVETTWRRWKEMHPGTKVSSDVTGYTRNYLGYPYGDYREDDGYLLFPVNPPNASTYGRKDLVLAIEGEEGSRAYAFEEMSLFGDRVIVNDELDGEPVVVVYEALHQMAIPYRAALDGLPLTFVGQVAE